MQRVEENYRKIRIPFRFVLQNITDFDPAQHAVKFEDMLPLDQYMLGRVLELSVKIRQWYDGFEFHRIYHQLNEFCTSDLSNVYFDVLKDRLYTAAPNSRARRSAQTAVWRIGETLVRLVAPIMTFTAEEIWSYLPKVPGREESVHLALFPKPEDITGIIASGQVESFTSSFGSLMAVRDETLKALENALTAKLIRMAVEAGATIFAPEAPNELLDRYL